MSGGQSRSSIERWRQHERILETFEAAWQGSQPPSVEEFLAQASHERQALLIELLRVDIECRRRAGLPASIERYLERFPELRADETVLAGLVGFSASPSLVAGNGASSSPCVHAKEAPFPARAEAPSTEHDAATYQGGKTDTVARSGAPSCGVSGARPFADNYELLEELGRGGMGVVYKAWNRRLQRHVAIKLLLGNQQFSPDHWARFLMEAEMLARFQHPNIVAIYEIGEFERQPYLVMEFVDGTTLTRRLANQSIEPREAAQLTALLADAVQSVHDKTIVHRDLKPSNILLTQAGEPKITDFGLARHPHSDLTTTGAVMGTPSYMAPEQAQGQTGAIGPRTDVYALGVILYEMTTGRVPFRAPTIAATLQQVIADEPVAPRRLQAGIARDLETICLKCLAKEPVHRYATAKALADDLRRFLVGEPIVARPTGWAEQSWKWARRQPRVAALLAAVVMLVAVSIGALFMAWREAARGAVLEGQRADAEGRAKEKALEQLYVHRILLADRELAAGKISWAQSYLDACPEELRQWEWFHLKQRCRDKHTPVLLGHKAGISSVAASSDGKLLVSASGDGSVRVWDDQMRQEPMILQGHKGSVNWVTLEQKENDLVSGGQDRKVIVWDLATRQPRLVFDQHDGALSCVALHPTKPWVASATFDGKVPGEVLVWDRRTAKVNARLPGHERSITCLTYSPDGTLLVSASHDRTVIVRNAASGEVRLRFAEHALPVACVAFSPDGQWLASASGPLQSNIPGDDEILVWSAHTGRVRRRFSGHDQRTVTLAFAPDGQRLASAGWDRMIRIWDLNAGQQLLALEGHTDAVMSLAFTPAGRLVSGSLDRTIRLWDAPR